MKYQDENGEFKDIIVRASDTLPIGFIGLNPSDIVPYGWLECNGQQVLRADYPDLFKVIGTTYNVSNDLDDDKFRLPNFQGRVPVGQSGSDVDFAEVGSTGGEKKHKLTIEELPSFRAEIKTWRGAGDLGYPGILGVSKVDGVQTSTSKAESVGGDQPHNIMQPYIVQNYIIKAKQTVAVVSQTVNEESTGNDKVYDVDYINNILGDLSTLTTENKDNLVQSLNETNEKANEIVRGTLNSMNGTTIEYASYFVYGYTLVLTAHITATKDVAQYMPVAVLSNGGKGLSGNAYVRTVDTKNCYLTKATGQIATYQSGGLKTGETLDFVGVFILSA